MEDDKVYRGHVLAVPYPSQGHINPMLQFSKRLASKGLKSTLATTHFIFKSLNPETSGSVHLETISDGYDEGGFAQAESIHAYLERMEAAGSNTVAALIEKYKNSSHPIDCVVYDSFLPWALDVAKKYGLAGAAFFTQACAVNYIYYMVHHGLLKVPINDDDLPVCVPGMPPLELPDMPSFIYVAGSYPAYFEMVLHQFLNVDKADWILVNSFYELEIEVVDSMTKVCPSMLTIGPTLPSPYLDNRVENDKDYGLNLFTVDSTDTSSWLHTKPPRSVVYLSFGSMSVLTHEQMAEIACALKDLNYYFIWVVRSSEESKIPKDFLLHYSCNDRTDVDRKDKKGLILKWSPQLEVLSSDAIGCFFTHCGWNSTIEALSMGVSMVGMPQWTDQTTNSKFIQDVWKVGVRVRVCEEDGIVKRQEIERCIREVMESERGKEMAKKALKWKELAQGAVSYGGSSDKNIDDFISALKIQQ